MSLVWRMAWATTGQDTHQEMVELAREGERLLRALGHTQAVTPSAAQLGPQSDSQTVSEWVDAYDAAAASVGGMPVSVLWAGAHWLDPRADAVIMRLAQSTPPTWATLVSRGNTLAAPHGSTTALRNALDWWAARGPFLQSGNEQQQAADRYARAWWAEELGRWRAPATPPTPPGATPPGATPNTQSGGGGWALAAVIFGGLMLAGRRRGRR